MIESVAHRGPDGQGWDELATPAGPLVLAHRRLAILDLGSTGAQPMERGGLRIVYNGEIYNYRELRQDLEASGHHFRSTSDTEVLLAAWQTWGPDTLNRLNGMFAFVIWDQSARSLIAVRDRFGVKPLYWRRRPHGIAFASEIKQFLSDPAPRPGLDLDSAMSFLAWETFDHSASTLLDGISQIPPGHWIHLDLSGPMISPPQVQRWYHPRQVEPLPVQEAALRFRELLTDAIRIRLRSDVSVGTSLSGGLDSSSILCLAGPSLTALTIGSVDSACDERPFARIAAKRARARLVEILPDDRQLPELLEKIIHHQDGPFSSASVLAQSILFATARDEKLPVMLDGQGADELLAGYHNAFAAHHAGLLRRGAWRRLGQSLLAGRQRGAGMGQQLAEMAAAWHRPLWHRWRRSPAWLTEKPVSPLPATPDLASLLNSQFSITSLPMLLHYEDRNSMAHGVEARLPFLDYRLVEFCWSLPDELKLAAGETKWLMRRALAMDLPPEIGKRRDKAAFPVPAARWSQGVLKPILQEGLAQAGRRFPSLFAPLGLKQLASSLDDHPDRAVWRVATFGLWSHMNDVSL